MRLLYIGADDAHYRAWRDLIADRRPGYALIADRPALLDTPFKAAFAYQPPPGRLSRIADLSLVFALGAGVDGLVDEVRASGAILVRMVNPAMTQAMIDYVLYAVTRYHRRFDEIEADQRAHRWVWQGPTPGRAALRIGVLGLGRLGAAVATALAQQGYPVGGWSRTPHALDGVHNYVGAEGLRGLLAVSDILVNLLPLTAETQGLLNTEAFDQLPLGARLIHVGRGGHLVEPDLLAALDTGRLAGATLDVFDREPLPDDHGFWAHPKIRITPHCASFSSPEDCWPVVADALDRLESGAPPPRAVDLAAGY
nr:glyoxylate/hydroxypyruvate reductase A [uncultured Brevundimonas sp.]